MESGSDHLLVLIHGLWGNASHFDYILRAIDQFYVFDDLECEVDVSRGKENRLGKLEYDPACSEKSASERTSNAGKVRARRIQELRDAGLLAHNSKYRKPYVLVTRSNEGYMTYDGIDMCGEKVVYEVEQALDSYEQQGIPINKISVVGYSLGGLMARYAIGILYQKGYFKKISPVNFATFCSPHIGVRDPGKNVPAALFNTLIPRTFSATGRQLFMIDKFATSQTPLLCLLADKSSVFFHALTLFSNHALYANITNDRRTSWFTAGISITDPFVDLHQLDTHCIKGYEPTILDIADPVSRKPMEEPSSSFDVSSALVYKSTNPAFSVLPRFLKMMFELLVTTPIWVLAFFMSAAIQTFYSSRRLREFHSMRKGRYGLDEFRLLQLGEQAEDVVDSVLEGFAPYNMSHHSITVEDLVDDEEKEDDLTVRVKPLEVSSEQAEMIENLNTIRWKKFPVHITKTKAAHAAVIVRHMDWKGMEEGEVVIQHWLTEILEV
ncbi:putative serine esterase-domain-containing protein [Lipomyces oligophaga]|uniref:putative serine esterase-domain-containing protein n=1 Tax=Lipomyces oligophaga TaxID=45792 RepID=UPI0034D0220A